MQLICVTNRSLCSDDFLLRLDQISAAGVDAILLREKDLSEVEYTTLAEHVKTICDTHGTKLILHTFISVANRLRLPIQLPLHVFRALSSADRMQLCGIGVSVHSNEEARFAAEHGADWLIAGHIFNTECKPNLPPRGLEFLHNICESVTIPTSAIGGITADKCTALADAGAAGCCVMSAMMQCSDPRAMIRFWSDSLMHG